MKTVLMALLALVSLVMIVVIMAQPSTSDGVGAINGGSEQFFGKKKAKGFEKKLEKITVVCAIIFIVVTLALVILE